MKISDSITEGMLNYKSENNLYLRQIFFASNDVKRTLVIVSLQQRN